jgi:hypothetical protein
MIVFLSKMISFTGGHDYVEPDHSHPDETGDILVSALIQAKNL